ncbi:MAG: site-specific integrase [Clostridium sp.]|nr:site-specific integrase [Clostridium sp.]
MWSEIKENGKVKYVERYTDPLTFKQKYVSITLTGKDTAANRKKALEELTRKIDRIQTSVITNNCTLSQVYDRYMAYQSKTVKDVTLERNRRTLRKLVNKFGKDAIVNNITVAYITDKLLAMPGSNVTRNEYIRRFKAMINWARKMDLHQNYKLCDNLEYFKEEQTKKERIQDKFLEPDEAATLLDHMKDSGKLQWYHLTRILLLSGLRIGEAVALEQADISDEYITINKTYDHINKIVTTPKTSTSNRDVYIQEELRDAIKMYKLYRWTYDQEHKIISPYFFHSNRGDYISYYAYEKYLRESSERILGRRITAHALRHTHASLLLAEGVDIDTISRRLGHENSRITKEIYLHMTQKLQETDNQQIKLKKIL